MTYYELLGLAPTATGEELRVAYRALVEIYHPDRMQAMREDVRAQAEQRLQRLNEAYTVLRDPRERARYDAALASAAPAATPEFVARGNPVVARGRLREQIEAIEGRIAAARARIETLRPGLEGGARLDDRWERYLFASLLLAWPFLFFGAWAAPLVAQAPLAWPAARALLGLLLAGCLALGAVSWAAQVSFRPVRWLLAVPLALALFLGVVLIGLPRSIHLVALLVGYAGIVWTTVGQPLSEERNGVLISASTIHRLEEEIAEDLVEVQRLKREMGRQ